MWLQLEDGGEKEEGLFENDEPTVARRAEATTV